MGKRQHDDDGDEPAMKRFRFDEGDIDPKFNLYKKPRFDDTIRKEEYRSYSPYVKSFNNSDVIEFIINQSDAFFAMPDTLLEIKGKLEITGGGKCELAPNFGAFLFDSCSYSECSREIEVVRDPGIVSTVRALTCYGPEYSRFMSIAGWNYPDNPLLNGSKHFNLLMPLKHIFNVFNDYTMITYGRQTFRLVRSRNDNDCVIVTEQPITGGSGSGMTSTTVKLIIESMEVKIKHIFPNDEIKIKLMEPIKNDRPILIPFRNWELNELPSITKDSKREIWAVKTSAAVERPRYILVCFQTDRRNKLSSDPTKFDNVNLTGVRVSLNGEYWPNERMLLDFKEDDYAIAHYNYTEFNANYITGTPKTALLNYEAFKRYALFVIDCSKQEETMKSSTVDVKLEIEADTGFPANTKAYCIIIHDRLMEYHPLTEVVKSII